MTERLPNLEETSWGNILGANDGTGGFLRVAHNDDGTQLHPGASYLYAQASDSIGNVNNVHINPEWNLLDVDGDDLQIDGDDATLIEFLTTGWYVKEVEASILPVTGDALIRSELDFGETVTFSFPLYWLVTGGTYPVNAQSQLSFTSEPTKWTAGQKMTVEVKGVTASAGTWDLVGSSSFLRVVRVA